MDLPRGKGQALARQPAGGEKEGQRSALVALTVTETADEAVEPVGLQIQIDSAARAQSVFA